AATSFNRSTDGLAGTDANTTGPVEIRFLFEANITTTEGRVPLATGALVNALYEGFSYRAVQSPSLAGSGAYPGSWPFLPENGWHVTTVGGRQAFWAGNDTTSRYDNNVDASSSTSADPALAAGLPFDSDTAGTASGFYVRDFDVRAPASYTGEVVESDTHYLIGTLSFWGPSVDRGGINLIRTPGGELLTYGATWDPPNVPSDSIY